MPTVIPVKFAYSAHDLWFDPKQTGAEAGDHVIVKTERGTEIGLATRDAFEAPVEELEDTTGNARLAPVLRIATDSDLNQAENLARKGEDALPVFRRLVERSGLDMKPVGVEYLFDGDKVVCYFAAEERVDFRQLVRDLSHELRARIDMRQIGVREEAAIVGGYAHCGQELCCARFGHQFEPVSIRMAKEQDLPLNSTKISGACGRLMCCLRYEFEAYRDFKGRAPKKNAVIDTPLGKAKIIEYDTPKEQLCLRLESGKQIRVPLGEMEASPAAVKKSEDLGCPCRPDTVLRETLDRILTPEIQMALAELDRKNGVIPEETFDQSDIFVEMPRKRRRKSNRAKAEDSSDSEQAAPGRSRRSRGAQAAEQNGEAAEGKTKTRRRRTRRGQAADQAPEQVEAPGTPRSRRNAQQPAAEQGGEAAAPTRRRHHRRAGDAGADNGAGQGHVRQPKSGDQGRDKGPQHMAEGKPAGEGASRRRTRRPGDKGGQQAQSGNDRSRGQAPVQSGEGTSADGSAPKRRRRHRGGRGRGKGNGGQAGNGGAPAAE